MESLDLFFFCRNAGGRAGLINARKMKGENKIKDRDKKEFFSFKNTKKSDNPT
jgi:hypothetical protein